MTSISSATDKFAANALVWALIDNQQPYWPAQILADTNGNDVKILVLNDPSLASVKYPNYSMKFKDQVNLKGRIKRTAKQKKLLNKVIQIKRTSLIPWHAHQNKGTSVNTYIATEFAGRMGYSSINEIDENVWDEWNHYALLAAQKVKKELDTAAELTRLKAVRQQEREELQKATDNEKERAAELSGQIYDGRIVDLVTGKKKGWELSAGDKIRYYASSKISNEMILITTKIIQLHDKYGTLRAKNYAPIVVEHSYNAPSWTTEIEKLPTQDPMKPVYYPLCLCKFVPSEIENEVEKEHMREHRKFAKRLQEKGWGQLFYNKNTECDTECDTDSDSVNTEVSNREWLQSLTSHEQPKQQQSQSDIFSLCDSTENQYEARQMMISYLCKQDVLDVNLVKSLDEQQKQALSRGVNFMGKDHHNLLIYMAMAFIPQCKRTHDEIEVDVDNIDDIVLIKMYNYMLKNIQQQVHDETQLFVFLVQYDILSQELPLRKLIQKSCNNNYKLHSKELREFHEFHVSNKILTRLQTKKLYGILYLWRISDYDSVEQKQEVDYILPKHFIQIKELDAFANNNLYLPQWIECIKCKKWRAILIKLNKLYNDKWRDDAYYVNWVCAPTDGLSNLCETKEIPYNKIYNDLQINMLKLQKLAMSIQYQIRTAEKANTNHNIHKSKLLDITNQMFELINEYKLQLVRNFTILNDEHIHQARCIGIANWIGYLNASAIHEFYAHLVNEFGDWSVESIKMLMDDLGFIVASVEKQKYSQHFSLDNVTISSNKDNVIKTLSSFLIYPINESLVISPSYLSMNNTEEQQVNNIEENGTENIEVAIDLSAKEIILNNDLSNEIIIQFIKPAIKILKSEYEDSALAAALKYMTNNNVKLKDDVWYNVFKFKSALAKCNIE